MTFNYYKEENGERFKILVEVDEKKLETLYDIYFRKYSNSKNIKLKLELNELIKLNSSEDYLISNFKTIKSDDNKFNISYTISNNPKVCKIIKGLLNCETFEEAYQELVINAMRTKKDNINNLRRQIDMKIRVLSVMIDEPNFDEKDALSQIKHDTMQLDKCCSFDKELACDLEPVYDCINIEKRLDNDLSNKIYFEPKKYTKVNKKISSF